MGESWPRSVHTTEVKILPYRPTRPRLIRCLLYGKNRNYNLIHFMYLVCKNWHFPCEWRWAEFNSSKGCYSSFLSSFFLISFLALTEINIVRLKQSMTLHFSLQLFHFTVRLPKPEPPRQWKPIRRQNWNNIFQHFDEQVAISLFCTGHLIG